MSLLLTREPDLRGERPRTTRAEELRLQLADEIVRGTLPPGSPARRSRATQVASACGM